QDLSTCTFEWDFGNGTTATGQNVNVTYNMQGSYTVTLTVTDVNACPKVETYTVDVACGGACPVCTDIMPTDPDVNTCVGTFWDSGLTGDYSVPANDTITICSDNGGFIQFHFNEFGLDNFDDDILRIYDGPDVNSPLFGAYSNSTPPPSDIVSSGTCLTFHFTSSTWSTPGSGWSAEISCADTCQNFELSINSDADINEDGYYTTCMHDTLNFVASVNFLENDLYYHQSIENTVFHWYNNNGLDIYNDSLTLPINSVFQMVFLEVMDTNYCYQRDTIVVIGECQTITPEILINNSSIINAQYSVSNGTELNISINIDIDSSNPCYNPNINYDFNIGNIGTDNSPLFLESNDTTISYPDYSTEWLILSVYDGSGCNYFDSLQVLTGCQAIDININSNASSYEGENLLCIEDSLFVNAIVNFPNNDLSYHQSLSNCSYTWVFGNGNTDTLLTSSNIYYYAGLYNTRIEITDSVGCVSIENYPIRILNDPQFQLNSSLTDTICLMDTLNLSHISNQQYQSYNYNPMPIHDESGVSSYSYLEVYSPNTNYITTMQDFYSICLNIEHSYVGDLSIYLYCPNGQSVELLNYPNSIGGAFFGEPCDNDYSITVGNGYSYYFTNSAPYNLSELNNINSHTFIDNDGVQVTHDYFPSGDYAPTGTFEDLIGCPVNGEWTLEIIDNLGADDGYLFYWGLNFNEEANGEVTQYWNNGEWSSSNNTEIIQNTNNVQLIPLDTGQYYFNYSINNVIGCSFDTIIGPVYVIDLPNEPEINGNFSVQNGDTAVYTTNLDTLLSYSWNIVGGSIYNQISNDSIQVIWNSNSNASVSLIAENSNGCSSYSTLYVGVGDTITIYNSNPYTSSSEEEVIELNTCILNFNSEFDQAYISATNFIDDVYTEITIHIEQGDSIYNIIDTIYTPENAVYEVVIYISCQNNTKTSNLSVLEIIDYVDHTTVNNNNLTEANFRIYPNPAKDLLYITAPSVITNYEVISLTGKLIKQDKPHTKNEMLSLEELSSGTYFIRIQTKTQAETLKFVKE
ncbi:MAG: T9SS type A sorting domain-containing protein, partial [Bacteroidales bacterium]|nr:T9SS type A sorting domain-containing protein [Bacteroidales bacterium]